MLRPLPNFDDKEALSKLGRLHAIRNARLDAVHQLRDSLVQLQHGGAAEIAAIANARSALDRIEQLNEIEQA
jgi:hypothetical protein